MAQHSTNDVRWVDHLDPAESVVIWMLSTRHFDRVMKDNMEESSLADKTQLFK